MIKAAIFDWNGTMCSDDLQVDSRVVAVWREIKAQGLFPFGPATGNNLDYCRELSRLVCDWDFCIAELGAVFTLRQMAESTAPIWRGLNLLSVSIRQTSVSVSADMRTSRKR